MTEPKPNRSRTAWPGPMSIAGLGDGHEHDLPKALVQRVRRQTWAVVILGVCIVAIGVLLLLIIAQRGERRDEENERLQDQIRQSTCDLLDQLPEGGLLDRPRSKYGCGPGIPFDSLTPDEQRRISGGSAPPTVEPGPSPTNTFRPPMTPAS